MDLCSLQIWKCDVDSSISLHQSRLQLFDLDISYNIYHYLMKTFPLLVLVLITAAEVIEINDTNFTTEVAANPEQLWMIMFGAEWVYRALCSAGTARM